MSIRIPSLDGLRALSICMVLVGHVVFSNGAPIAPNEWTHAYAHYGVCIFFVISGFLITSLLERERAATGAIDVKQFYVRRAYRILPVAYLFMGAMILLHRDSITASQAASVLTYTSSYVKGMPFYFTHLWSLSVEEQFYLIWPLLVVLGFSKRFAWAAIVVGPVSRWIFHKFGASHYAMFSFPGVVDSVAAGCLLALYQPQLRQYAEHFTAVNFRILFGAMLLLPAAYLLALKHPHWKLVERLLSESMWTVANLVVALCVQAAVLTKPRVLNTRLIVWIGTLSYSLYIWQMPLTDPASKLFVARFPLNIPAAFGAAMLSYYFVERPVLNRRHRNAAKASPAPNKKAAALSLTASHIAVSVATTSKVDPRADLETDHANLSFVDSQP